MEERGEEREEEEEESEEVSYFHTCATSSASLFLLSAY